MRYRIAQRRAEAHALIVGCDLCRAVEHHAAPSPVVHVVHGNEFPCALGFTGRNSEDQ